jgi:hypothetical protein
MGIAEVVWQMTSYSKMFEVGSLHLIHGRTTISPADRDTAERQRGLSEAAPSRNGRHPVQVLFYGFMENVSSQPFTLSQGLIALPFNSGCRKERHLVCQPSAIYVSRTNSVGQFHDHREHRLHEEIWARLAGIFLL